jgi:hypothetical protein
MLASSARLQADEREEAHTVPDRAPRRPTSGSDAPLGVGREQETPPTVQPQLGRGEQLLVEVRGIGAAMFVTTERLIVARDGPERRPRSGIQSFQLDAISHIRLEPGSPPSGRIAVWVGGHEGVSMFFDARSRDRAQEAVDRAREAIAVRRRERRSIARRMSG